MEKLSGKLQLQAQGVPIEKEDEANILGNDGSTSVYQHNRSIDINQPPEIEQQDQLHFSIGPEINFEVKPASEESKEISVIKAMMNGHKNCLGVDFKLKISPQRPSSCISSSSSTSSNRAYIYSMFHSDENLVDTSKDEQLPFILVGCSHCYMYMLVSKDDPKCIICKNRVLIDKFE